jgi:hypothetical protein
VDAAAMAGLDEQVNVALEEGTSIVTCARFGSVNSGRLRNFLMKLKM